MRNVLCAVALVGFLAAGASANLLVNGDFSAGLSGWTYWNAPWGTVTVDTAGCPNPGNPEPSASHSTGHGSGGIYQVVAVAPGTVVTVDADWTGDLKDAGWAEVMLFSPSAGEDIAGRIDAGNAADIAYKKDSWGMNPPTAWDWEPASLSPHPSGNGGTITVGADGLVVVATKLGTVGAANWACFDNITLVPEPATMALLGLSGLALLRRRR